VIATGRLPALWLSPEMGVPVLMVPAAPLLVGLRALEAGSYALSGALWVSWALSAIFPLR
jgi:hypothetical protein